MGSLASIAACGLILAMIAVVSLPRYSEDVAAAALAAAGTLLGVMLLLELTRQFLVL